MTNRRQFLTTTLSAALGTQVSSCATLAGGGHIDAHVHVWTPDTEKYPLATGFTKAQMKPASFTPEQLFAHCKPEGVTRIVLVQMSYYKTDNRYMLNMMTAHPGTFSGVAIIDETAADVRGAEGPRRAWFPPLSTGQRCRSLARLPRHCRDVESRCG